MFFHIQYRLAGTQGQTSKTNIDSLFIFVFKILKKEREALENVEEEFILSVRENRENNYGIFETFFCD